MSQPEQARPNSNAPQEDQAAAGAALSVQLIAERVVVRIHGSSGWRAAELSLAQARLARDHLDEAISLIESGESVATSLAGLLAALAPDHERPTD
jgi:hypothetical protein